MTKVKAHLVEVGKNHKTKNFCGEINLPVLMEPRYITLLELQGIEVFDYTVSLCMEEEWVDKNSCYVPSVN